MYNYYQQQPTTSYPKTPSYIAPPPPMLKGHPVSSLEEVKATSIDFDGSIFYFPDLANKRIYTKTVDMQGIASLNMYELKPLPQDAPSTGDFITRQEFEAALTELTKNFQATLIQQQPIQPQPQQPMTKKPSENNYKGDF